MTTMKSDEDMDATNGTPGLTTNGAIGREPSGAAMKIGQGLGEGLGLGEAKPTTMVSDKYIQCLDPKRGPRVEQGVLRSLGQGLNVRRWGDVFGLCLEMAYSFLMGKVVAMRVRAQSESEFVLQTHLLAMVPDVSLHVPNNMARGVDHRVRFFYVFLH